MPYTETHMAKTKERLEDLRKESRLSYEQLSRRLEEQGSPISHTNLKNYEIGDPEHRLYNRTRGMSIENLVALADAFGVSVDYLLGRSESRKAEYHQMSEELRLSNDAVDSIKEMAAEDNDAPDYGRRTTILDELLTDADMLAALESIQQAAYAYDVARVKSSERALEMKERDEELAGAEKYLQRYGMKAVGADVICGIHVADALSLMDGVIRKLPIRLVEDYHQWLASLG